MCYIINFTKMPNLKLEKTLFQKGAKFIGGIDEAGRGPLAGPVVAACVVLDANFKINKETQEIKDSKKLSAVKREKLVDVIFASFTEVGIGICDHATIDRINILQATFLAMKKAIGALKQKPDFILTDGKFGIPNISIKQKAIINGDNLSLSIAAASIIAKVKRDEIMLELHEKYPQYGFDKHKGYGTKLHMEALQRHGSCPMHRKSFKPVAASLILNNK
ncbi:ribonuclease HII [Candidatus Parcubacteria bacterium]|nr:ribonuclease HII [Candidatus Parcubacteria bacterium]